jgi:hypothetical protein
MKFFGTSIIVLFPLQVNLLCVTLAIKSETNGVAVVVMTGAVGTAGVAVGQFG